MELFDEFATDWKPLEMKTFCFDLDGTLCTQVRGDYLLAEPYPDRIEAVNSLFTSGHVVKIFTARGSQSGTDWAQQTQAQLSSWGLLFHELILGKPHADVYVDDKSRHPEQLDWANLLKIVDN